MGSLYHLFNTRHQHENRSFNHRWSSLNRFRGHEKKSVRKWRIMEINHSSLSTRRFAPHNYEQSVDSVLHDPSRMHLSPGIYPSSHHCFSHFRYSSHYSGNILSAFNGYNVISAGSSTVIFGVLGVYVAYMFMNWEALAELRTQLCCIIGIIVFLSIISSFSTGVDYLGHLGGIIGGFFLSLAAFPTILPKKKWVMGLGAGGLSGYFLTTFLVFFLWSFIRKLIILHIIIHALHP